MKKIGNKNKKFTVILIFLVLIVSLVLAEIGIRIYHFTCDRERFIWLPDQFLGYVHSSNNTFKHHYTENERITIEHKTNAYGFLGEDISQDKEQDTLRILVLGDSFTEAIQVSSVNNFCGRIQRLLNNLPGKRYKKVEVLNAGVSGYSPLNYYLSYTRELARFKPDLVLVQIFANDVFEDNTARAKSLLDENELPLNTHRYITKKYWEHPLVKRKDFNSNPIGYRFKRFMSDQSRMFEYFYVKFYNMQKASAFHQKMKSLKQFETGYQFFILDPDHFLSKDEAFREKAWGYSQKYLLALKEEVERHDSQFLLFYMPIEVQLGLDQYGEHVSMYVQKQMGTTFNDMLKTFSLENNINYLDLLNDFESNKSKGLYLSRDGHLTESGHQVTARALFQYIIQNGLLEEEG